MFIEWVSLVVNFLVIFSCLVMDIEEEIRILVDGGFFR